MAQHDEKRMRGESPPWISGPTEPESHTEHQAALDATLFRCASDPYELVLELDAGELRLRADLSDEIS